MSAGLLNLEHEAVRNNTYRFGERLAQSSSGQGHYYLLDMLSHLELADSFPHHCAEYYRLLTEIIRTISNMPPQVCLAQHREPASPWKSLSLCMPWQTQNFHGAEQQRREVRGGIQGIGLSGYYRRTVHLLTHRAKWP